MSKELEKCPICLETMLVHREDDLRQKLVDAEKEIKRLKKYIKSLTTDTFHNPEEI